MPSDVTSVPPPLEVLLPPLEAPRGPQSSQSDPSEQIESAGTRNNGRALSSEQGSITDGTAHGATGLQPRAHAHSDPLPPSSQSPSLATVQRLLHAPEEPEDDDEPDDEERVPQS